MARDSASEPAVWCQLQMHLGPDAPPKVRWGVPTACSVPRQDDSPRLHDARGLVPARAVLSFLYLPPSLASAGRGVCAGPQGLPLRSIGGQAIGRG